MVACSGQQDREPADLRSPREIRENRIEAQRDFLERENASIESYIADRGFSMQRSGTGIYYQIEPDSLTGATASEGDRVVYHYEVYLLNGEKIYSSGGRPAQLRVDREDAIIGLHEALKKLSVGQKGRFIIPSHLAYGVAGDQQKVPPLTALQYNLELLAINPKQSKK